MENCQPCFLRDGDSSLRQIEVLPPPDGDDMTTMVPGFRFIFVLELSALFDVLHQLPHLLNFFLDGNNHGRDAQVGGF